MKGGKWWKRGCVLIAKNLDTLSVLPIAKHLENSCLNWWVGCRNSSWIYNKYIFFLIFHCQRHLRQLSLCARTFGEILELADIDLSIFQEAVTAGSTSHELHQLLPNAVAYLFDLTTITQREMEGFGRCITIWWTWLFLGRGMTRSLLKIEMGEEKNLNGLCY